MIHQTPTQGGNKSTWIIVIVVLLVVIGLPICMCGGCVAAGLWGVSSVISGSEPYQHALASAKANPEVIDELGEPIEASLLSTGRINITNDGGECDLSIPLSGPKGNGTLKVRGTRSSGRWEYQELKVQTDNRTIDLQ